LPPIIRVAGLVKTFGDITAVRDVSFAVDAGEMFAFLGPNGAGKTTTIKMLTTLLTPTSGSVEIDGQNPATHAIDVRRKFGIVFQDPSLDQELTAAENMRLHAALYSVPKAAREERIERLLKVFELWDRRDSLVKQFSGGMRRRLEIARGLLHTPKILFLDEPTLGLDPDVSVRVRRHVADLRRDRGMTIVLTTHYMREAEELCDEIGFIKAGRILAQGTADGLKRQLGLGYVVALKLEPRPAWLAEAPGVLRCVDAGDGWIDCTVDEPEKRVPELLRAFMKEGIEVRNLQVREPELEEVFVELAR
jgi:ABC-2 type transport system ATP-binding protein